MRDYFAQIRPTMTFEIFPPKGSGDLASIFATVDALASLAPDLISVTYGAGGTSRENTVEIASQIQNSYAIPALAHLTCAGNSNEELDPVLRTLSENGVKNILALRGDIAEGEKLKDFRYASDLISYIKSRYDFRIFAACYPEKHIEAYSVEDDLRCLKEKRTVGSMCSFHSSFLTMNFYRFRDQAKSIGIDTPIVAGIMPITSSSQISRMVSMCGATVPEKVQKIIRAFGHNSMAMKEAGIAYATAQIVDLLATGVDGIHLYTMNQPDIAKRISENIRGILYSLRVKRG